MFIPLPAILRITFRESIFFYCTGTAFRYKLKTVKDTFIDLLADVVPYEIITTFRSDPRYFLVLRTEQFVCPIYSTPFDVSYVPYEIIQSDSQSKRPISRNSITFDPD